MVALTRTKLLVADWLEPDYAQVLLVSPRGFLLAYDAFQLPIDNLLVQLGPFDAEDWGSNIEQFHADEVGALSERCMKDARPLLQKVLPQDFGYSNIRLLQSVHGNLSLYNRLLSNQPEKVDLRLQALYSVPVIRLILPLLDDASIKIRDCIDTSGNLWDMIFALFPGRKATLKRLAKDEHFFEFWRRSLPELQQLLDVIPLQKIPSGYQDWKAFVDVYRGLRLENENDERRKKVKIRWLIEISKMGWVKTRDKYVDLPEGLSALGDALDFIDEVARAGKWLVKNVKQCHRSANIPEWELESLFWDKATHTWGMSRIVEASRIWHPLMIVGYNTNYERPAVLCLKWEPLFKESVWLNQVVCAVVLCQSTDLDKESSQLQHCVSSYEYSCHLGDCHIVSLRNRDGASLSTLEIVYREESNPAWKIVQHKGISNQTPEDALLALEPLLINHIQKNADLTALKQWQETAKEQSARITPVKRNVWEKFDLDRLRKLSEAMGSKRLMGLFVDEATIKDAEQKFRNKQKNHFVEDRPRMFLVT